MTPNFLTHKIRSNLNNTTLVQISGEIVPFSTSTIKLGLKQCFRHQNLQIGPAGTYINIQLRPYIN